MEVSHELSSELGAAITNDFARESELTPYMVTIDLGGSKGREFHIGREYYDVLGESVDDD